MSRDFDEAPEAELLAELEARAGARARGLCDYCHRGPKQPPCKFPERHFPSQFRDGVHGSWTWVPKPWDGE